MHDIYQTNLMSTSAPPLVPVHHRDFFALFQVPFYTMMSFHFALLNAAFVLLTAYLLWRHQKIHNGDKRDASEEEKVPLSVQGNTPVPAFDISEEDEEWVTSKLIPNETLVWAFRQKVPHKLLLFVPYMFFGFGLFICTLIMLMVRDSDIAFMWIILLPFGSGVVLLSIYICLFYYQRILYAVTNKRVIYLRQVSKGSQFEISHSIKEIQSTMLRENLDGSGDMSFNFSRCHAFQGLPNVRAVHNMIHILKNE